jgi:hypothetical protein
MLHIVVSDEQARLIGESTDNVEIRDGNGNLLGYVAHGFSEDDIAIARSRAASSQLRLTTPQVLNYLNSLEPR